MAKKVKNPEIIFDFANEEDLDICGFSDAPIEGKCIATFSCNNNNSNSEIIESAQEELNKNVTSDTTIYEASKIELLFTQQKVVNMPKFGIYYYIFMLVL